jgi:hypothetical protein
MHPDFLRALAKARHEDLLSEHPSRRQARVRVEDETPRFARSRRRVGSLLIWLGARLIGDQRDQRAALELGHE